MDSHLVDASESTRRPRTDRHRGSEDCFLFEIIYLNTLQMRTQICDTFQLYIDDLLAVKS